ncbi:hypothetical protein PISMIDRAFT_397995 [Pisolithus microcarpus 441]|uniref:Uncharacterized protein n=1 Tax=Pisolithus microcarpus 441 TaxID=765257 RepID=A0A0C9Z656_9AGAM|nr:hypothetical protein PISMIDRAFT_397995 [Pisolithus microcarpus 441]
MGSTPSNSFTAASTCWPADVGVGSASGFGFDSGFGSGSDSGSSFDFGSGSGLATDFSACPTESLN